MTGTSFFLMQKKILIRLAKAVTQPGAIACPQNRKSHQYAEYQWKNCFAPTLMDRSALVRQPVTRGMFSSLRENKAR
tara:strand:+ start:116 stop:346 length:231 start_codon:yes stop_codon:yes gene_type:complete